MTDDLNRKPDGKFAANNNANPTGNNGIRNRGLQRYGDRAAYLLQKYSIDDVKRIVLNHDGQQQRNVSFYDIIILTQLAGTIAGNDRRGEREALLDRLEGKPKQPLEHSSDPANPEALDARISELLGKAGIAGVIAKAPDPASAADTESISGTVADSTV